MSKNVYRGRRYVPKIMGTWDNTKQTPYEPLSIVQWGECSYTSKIDVPVGIDILNEKYWVSTGNYNAQVELYRQETQGIKQETQGIKNELIEVRKDVLSLKDTFINVKSFGAKGDGITDDTISIQNAIDNAYANGGGNVLIPSGVYMVKADGEGECWQGKGIIMKDNVNLIMNYGAILKCIPNSKNNYKILNFDGVKNAKAINCTIVGDRKNHITTPTTKPDINVDGFEGEWGHGIHVRNSSNIIIENATSYDCWGDGIVIEKSNDVIIRDFISNNNRRQGLSLISGKNITIINPKLSNTNGTLPQCGIDIEPNTSDEIIENINIINPYTENNANSGITINLSKISNVNKAIEINIDGHIDNGSTHGFYIGSGLMNNIKGSITFNNPIWKNNKENAMLVRKYAITNPRIVINNPKIKDNNQSNKTGAEYSSSITIFKDLSDTDFNEVSGNIEINNLAVENTDSKNSRCIYIGDKTTTSYESFDKIKIINPIKLECTSSPLYIQGKVIVEDKNNILVGNYDGTTTRSIGKTSSSRTITNDNATGVNTVVLESLFPVGYREFTFIVTSNNYIRIVPEEGATIYPIGTVNKYIQSNTIGSKITLKRFTNNSWLLTEIVGTWDVQP